MLVTQSKVLNLGDVKQMVYGVEQIHLAQVSDGCSLRGYAPKVDIFWPILHSKVV